MMLKVKTETTAKDGTAAARNSWARTCDNCYSAPAAVYCGADFAYLCRSCDATVHQLSALHERVVVCESCEIAPAAFLCKADAASLCASCDADVHSANPLARRHHRVPIQPISPFLYGRSNLNPNPSGLIIGPPELADDEDEEEAASWLLPNPMKNGGDDERRAAIFAGEDNEYLDLDEYNHFNYGYNTTTQQQQRHYGVVPFQKEKNHSFNLGFEVEYSSPSSISSMDVGVVPESETEASIISHARPPKGTIELFSRPPPTQLTRMDREARVLRYREKKKTRKFDKTIRYASRKAYAETRPRIKGRFAKRKVAEDYIFSSESLVPDIAYGVVPSF